MYSFSIKPILILEAKGHSLENKFKDKILDKKNMIKILKIFNNLN